MSVLVTPSTSASTQRNTVTTSAMTKTVIPVETFRTKRFRKLYFSGIAISDHLPQAVDDLDPRRPDRRNDAREDSDADRDEEREGQDRQVTVESCKSNGATGRLLQIRDDAGNQAVLREQRRR